MSDVEIGRALSALRRERSQAALADEMKRRGFKWSQSTVWSIERGDRPLRLSEAAVVAEILGVALEELLYHESRRDIGERADRYVKQMENSYLAFQDGLFQVLDTAYEIQVFINHYRPELGDTVHMPRLEKAMDLNRILETIAFAETDWLGYISGNGLTAEELRAAQEKWNELYRLMSSLFPVGSRGVANCGPEFFSASGE